MVVYDLPLNEVIFDFTTGSNPPPRAMRAWAIISPIIALGSRENEYSGEWRASRRAIDTFASQRAEGRGRQVVKKLE